MLQKRKRVSINQQQAVTREVHIEVIKIRTATWSQKPPDHRTHYCIVELQEVSRSPSHLHLYYTLRTNMKHEYEDDQRVI